MMTIMAMAIFAIVVTVVIVIVVVIVVDARRWRALLGQRMVSSHDYSQDASQRDASTTVKHITIDGTSG